METRIELPGCTLQEVHQAGAVLTFYSRDGQPPHTAELVSNDGRLSAEIGLEWEGNTLTGYDGVFELPAEVEVNLRKLGFLISL